MYRSEKNISRPLSLKIECQLGEYDNMTLLIKYLTKNVLNFMYYLYIINIFLI
jgi:hypothetical protein